MLVSNRTPFERVLICLLVAAAENQNFRFSPKLLGFFELLIFVKTLGLCAAATHLLRAVHEVLCAFGTSLCQI
jgi:hypothetical protein